MTVDDWAMAEVSSLATRGVRWQCLMLCVRVMRQGSRREIVDGAGVDKNVLRKGVREKRETEKKNEPDGLERVHADEV